MKDRCIDDVAIPYSFVSRNYRKDLSSCTTIFCFSKFDIAHDLVQALCNDTAQKMSAHAPLLEPFERPDLRFFFCKHKLARVLPPRQQTFFSRGVVSRGVNDKKLLRDNRCDELHCHVTAAQLQLLSSHLLPQYFFC